MSEVLHLRECFKCGGNLETTADIRVLRCKYCGSEYFYEDEKNEVLITSLNRANEYRRKGDFDHAITEYNAILKLHPGDDEANWGMFIARCGIEYLMDDKSGNFVPTCHRTLKNDVLSDEYYLAAVKYAEPEQAESYKLQAKAISRIQKQIKAQMAEAEEYDVFISFKSKDKDGHPTKDAVVARNIYDKLNAAGIKTFFSEVTLKNSVGLDYEPIIYKALYTCKYFILVSTSEEHTNAVWVKNEWSRFRDRMNDEKISDGNAIAVFRGRESIPQFMRSRQGFDLENYPNGGYETAVLDFIVLNLKTQPKVYVRHDEEQLTAVKQLIKSGDWARADARLRELREHYEKEAVKECDIPLEYYWSAILTSFKVKNDNALARGKKPEEIEADIFIKKILSGNLGSQKDKERAEKIIKKSKSSHGPIVPIKITLIALLVMLAAFVASHRIAVYTVNDEYISHEIYLRFVFDGELDTAKLDVPKKDGYNESVAEIKDNFLLTGVNLNYSPITYKVTFNGFGGVGEMTEIDGVYDTALTLPENTFVREGYDFVGWATCEGGEPLYSNMQNAVNLTNKEENMTLYAAWKPHEYTVTYKADGEVIGTRIFTVENMSVENPPVPKKPGYTAKWEEYTLTLGDITVEPIYEIVKYTIKYDSAGGTYIADKQHDYQALTTAPEDPTRDGCIFKGWMFDGTDEFTFGSPMPARDVVATAIWEYKTVNYDSGYEEKKIDASYEYDYDTFNISDLSAFMKDGYKLKFELEIYMWEENEGYQEIYLRNNNGVNIADIGEFAHGGGGRHSAWWEYFTFIVEGEECTDIMLLRYGAHGAGSDDWFRGRAKVTVTVVEE